MRKKAKALSALEIKNKVKELQTGFADGVYKSPQRHPVGGVDGIYIQVSSATSSSWILRVRMGSKRPEIGLGSYPDIPLAKVKELAVDIKLKAKYEGINPVSEKREARQKIAAEQIKHKTFKQAAELFIEKKSAEYKTPQQTRKLTQQLTDFAYPVLGDLFVKDIELAHIEAVLRPIWETKTETARRTRMYIERVLDLAEVKGWRSGANPARWQGFLDQVFVKPEKIIKVQHYKALPVEDMPTFWSKLVKENFMGAYALQFGILTAARSGEIRQAKWEQIDFENKVWTIPADNMKASKQHRVPLSKTAINILNELPRLADYIFVNNRNKPLSDVTISKTPKRIGYDVTAHGFRSTFKDWARLHTDYPDEVSELALAHVNDDKTRAAYARDELLDKRRDLMDDWESYCINRYTSQNP